MPGENCSPLGNVLSETSGNMITIRFSNQVESVIEIGMLNVNDSSTNVAVTTSSSTTTLNVPNLGQNSAQTVPIGDEGTPGVTELKLTLGGFNGLSYIDFCYFPETQAPNFVGPPALNPTQPPTILAPTPPVPPTPPPGGSPTATPPPTNVCIEATVDFDTLPDGTKLPGGEFVDDVYLEFYGFTMSASGGFGTVPRLFNTSDFSDGTSRNAALGRCVLLVSLLFNQSMFIASNEFPSLVFCSLVRIFSVLQVDRVVEGLVSQEIPERTVWHKTMY